MCSSIDRHEHTGHGTLPYWLRGLWLLAFVELKRYPHACEPGMHFTYLTKTDLKYQVHGQVLISTRHNHTLKYTSPGN